MTLKGAIIRSVLQQNATFLITFATGIVIARIISPAEFGNYSIAMAVMFVVMALRDFGISSFVISDASGDDTLVRAGFGLGLMLTCVLSGLLVAASWPLAQFYASDNLGRILRIAALGPIATALVFPATVLLSRAMRFDALLVIGVVGAMAQAALSLLLATLGHGALALGWGQLAGTLVSAMATVMYCPRSLRLAPSLTGWGHIAGFSGIMSLTLLIGSTATSTPQLLIGRLLGTGEAALFSRASAVVSIILSAFFFAVTRPMLRRLAEAEQRGDDISALYLRIIACVTGLAWPAYAALCIWASPLIVTLYGSNWAAAGTMVAPVALGQALTLAIAPHHDVLVVKRRQRLLLASEAAVLVVTATLLAAALLAGLAVHHAAWALTAGGAFFAVWYFIALRSVVGFSPAAMIAVWARSLAVTLAVMTPLIALRMMHEVGLMSFFAAVFTSGALAAVIWLIALKILRHELHAHVEPLLQGLRVYILRRRTIAKERS